MASSIPIAACCIPRRALSGRVRLRNPRMKRTDAPMYAAWMKTVRIRRDGERGTWTGKGSSFRFRFPASRDFAPIALCAGAFVGTLEHLQHAIHDEKAA